MIALTLINILPIDFGGIHLDCKQRPRALLPVKGRRSCWLNIISAKMVEIFTIKNAANLWHEKECVPCSVCLYPKIVTSKYQIEVIWMRGWPCSS